jgi:hypothetical protein|tara:strand:- start:1893 stop:2240 length:348 start_codon:yes stop_codon:yes gene_type:complete
MTEFEDYYRLFSDIHSFSNDHKHLFTENSPLFFYYHAINNKQNFQLRLCKQGDKIDYLFQGALYSSGGSIDSISHEFKDSREPLFVIVKNFQEALERSDKNLSRNELEELDKLLS